MDARNSAALAPTCPSHPEIDLAEERKTFAASFASLRQGFTGTLDQLAAYLAKA